MSENQTLSSVEVSERHMMATASLARNAKPASFPRGAVEAKLRDELIEAIKIEATIRGISLPTSSAGISKAPVHVDSLVVVSILCAIEPIVGFEVSDAVVRAGGYASAEAALIHVLTGLEKEWVKKGA